ncbi:Asparagine synthetase [glutamine-hydrolyzing] [plant metagenome]|uniref:Asparagine synthetase [glutamine-hydrolyzing] n=1 Tax=plant metagenome TaxID=1297885 RepID=A0A484SQ42_9ZZZZ
MALLAEKMARQLAHRGPDAMDVWADESAGIALGHRRLAIMDLSENGSQPMCSASGRYVIAFNGEIYNFADVRARLEAEGKAPAWRGHSDTEVCLAAIEAWGFAVALAEMIGMFAIALWDRSTSSLSLARDRVGEKPLYYGSIDGRFVFASELKAIRVVGVAGELRVDRNALAGFMRFGYVPAPRSIYEGIKKLPAAHYAIIASDGSVSEPVSYWSHNDEAVVRLRAELADLPEEALIDRADHAIRQSISRQSVADVPLGAFLSGGVDSSAVVALMVAQAQQRISTYTIGFREKGFDEAPYAKAVAAHLGTNHTELYVSAQDAESVIPELSRIYDEPFADSSQIPSILVSRLTRQHVTVALSGDGGDEIFQGYPRYGLTAGLWQRTSRVPMAGRRLASQALRLMSVQQWDALFGMLPESTRRSVNGRRIHRMAQLMLSHDAGEMYERLMSQWQPEDGLVLGVDARFQHAQDWKGQGDAIDLMRNWDFMQYLPDDLLVKVDRAAMSASLETRAPLLDREVVELAFALPRRVQIRGGQGKWVLRKVLDRYVPRHLIERPKAGFSIPLADWLRGPLRSWAESLLDPQVIRGQGYLDAEKVSGIWQQHVSGKFDRGLYLWNVLMFQAWLKDSGMDAREGREGSA